MAKGKENSKTKEIRKAHIGKGPRLYVKGIFTGFRRNKVWTLNNQALLKLEGVNSKNDYGQKWRRQAWRLFFMTYSQYIRPFNSHSNS